MGGLSYSDVLESARGWAATILAQQGAEGALRERARGEVERDHAEGLGGLHAKRMGGARREFPLLVQTCHVNSILTSTLFNRLYHPWSTLVYT